MGDEAATMGAADSPAGYRFGMSRAIDTTFDFASGGSHFVAFSAMSAASIVAGSAIRLCRVPARLTSLFVRSPFPTVRGLACAVAAGFDERTVSRSTIQAGRSATGSAESTKQ